MLHGYSSVSCLFLFCFFFFPPPALSSIRERKARPDNSRHILCTRISCRPVRKLFLGWVSAFFWLPLPPCPSCRLAIGAKEGALAVGQVAPSVTGLAPVSRCMILALSALDCLIARGQQNPFRRVQIFFVIEYSTHLPNPLSFFGLTTLEILPLSLFCQVCAC